MANLGDTFRLCGRATNNHIFVIISDPSQDPQKIVTANFTTWARDKDQSCIIQSGQHPLITRKSCVRYSQDKLIDLPQLEALIQSGHVNLQSPVTPDLLQQIHVGAKVSLFIPIGNRQVLIDQGLI